jgi:uncharacterized membrane protein
MSDTATNLRAEAQALGEGIPAPGVVCLAACGTAMAFLVPVLLHQCGVIDHLPDIPGAVFDSDRITESKAAHPLGVPDGLLGLGSYAATMGLLVLARRKPKVRPLLALKLGGDAALASFNVVRQVVQFRRICSWCTGTALATGVMLYAGRDVLAGAVNRAKRLRRQD